MRVYSVFFALIFFLSIVSEVCGRARIQDIRPEYFGKGNARCSGRGLASQGFSGVMNRETKIKFVGKIIDVNTEILIFYYYWTNIESMHGHHRILIMKYNCEYVGSYIFNGVSFHVSGSSIMLDVPEERGNVIHFRNGTPPRRVWIDGQNPNLIR